MQLLLGTAQCECIKTLARPIQQSLIVYSQSGAVTALYRAEAVRSQGHPVQ